MKLNIDVKNKDLERVKAMLENDVANGIIQGDLSTDNDVIKTLEDVIKGFITNLLVGYETEKKKQEIVITVDSIDLS